MARFRRLSDLNPPILSADERWQYLLPAAPTGVTATAGNAQAAVSWTAPASVAEITDYVVQYSSNGGSSWTTFSDGTSTATSVTVTGLTNGTAYTFRVAAVSGIGQGAYSTASSGVTPGVFDPFFSQVALLLHMDGTGSTFTDSSGTPKTIAAVGNATQSTAQSKFGGKAGYFDGAGDYLTASGISLGSSDFVIEGWFYIPSVPSTGSFTTLFSHRATASDIGGALLVMDGASLLYFIASGFGTWQVSGVSTGLSAVQGQWMHIALVRSGSTCRAYLNGTGGTPVSVSDSIGASGSFTIMAGTASGTQEVAGYCDDFRVTIGTDRGIGAAATITVPTAAFPDA